MSDIPTNEPEDFDLGEIEEADDGEEAAEEVDVEGQDGDEGGEVDEAEGGEGDVAPSPAPARTGRKSAAQRWRDRAERTERELASLRQQVQGLAQPRPDPEAQRRAAEQEQALLEQMSPAEVYRYQEQKFQQRLQMQQLSIEDRIDKQAYDAAARNDPVYARHKDAVERIIAAEQAQGRFQSRETVLTYVIGEEARKRATSDAPRQRRAAARRVAGAQARPTGSRSDAGGGRRPAGDSYEAALARLKGQPIW